MSFIIWNCRGAGGRSFPGLIRDCFRLYDLDFIAIQEPRISGARADIVINKCGVDGIARVEASGFSGGIWCLWKNSRIAISVISTSRYCIHLKVNPSSANPWFLSVIYASLQQGLHEHLWDQLIAFSSSIVGPWCVGGDFNIVLYESEKSGGAPINYPSCMVFSTCLDQCNLLDLGYKGPQVTWAGGDLRERLDRVVCNQAWLSLFVDSSMVNLPLPSTDHCGLWIRLSANGPRHGTKNYFKFLGPWLEHPEFRVQLENSWRASSSWNDNISRLSNTLKAWNHDVFGNIFKKKKRILDRLEGIQCGLLQGNNERLLGLKEELWDEYCSILLQEEAYWYQQARSKWIKLGDRNTRFFHHSTISKEERIDLKHCRMMMMNGV